MYAVTLLFVAFEILRSLSRVDLVVFAGYTELGEAVLAGRDPYALHLNTWPPFFGYVAALIALGARVSLRGALLVWQLGSVAAIWGACRLLARFFVDRGETLSFWPAAAGDTRLDFTSPAILVPVAMMARLFQEHLQHTQVNLFVFYLVLLALHWFRERRAAWGGGALALAASLKAVPVLLVGYLAFRRRWRDAAWTGAALVALNVALPLAIVGPREAGRQWSAWRAVASREIAAPDLRHYNQSLLAAVKRAAPAPAAAADTAIDPTAGARRWFYGLAGLGAVGLVIAFGWQPPPRGSRREAAEWAICLGAMTIVSPLAWKAHYVTLLAPYCVAWLALRARPTRWGWGLWWGSFLCLTLSAPAVIGGRARDLLESYSVITIGAVLVVLCALRGLRDTGEPVAGNARHA